MVFSILMSSLGPAHLTNCDLCKVNSLVIFVALNKKYINKLKRMNF